MALPGFSPDLGYGTGFKWGGRVWGQNDMNAFIKALGPKRYARWARNHPGAAQTFDPVSQQMLGIYKPQLDAIARQREMERQYYDRLSHNLGGFVAALGSLLGGGPGAVSDLYHQGADTMTAGGKAYGAQLNADQAANAASDNTELAAINSPAKVNGGDAGSVLAGVAGWLPAEMMGQQGQAWTDRMAHFPTEAALQANLMMKDLMAQAQSADAGWAGKVSDLLAGMPADRAKVQSMIDAQKNQQFQQQLAMLKFQSDQAYRAYLTAKGKKEQAQAAARLKIAQKRLQDAENRAMGLAPNGQPLPGYVPDPTGGGGYVKPPKPPKGSTSASTPGTPAWRAKAVQNVGKAQASIEKDVEKLMKTANIHINPMDPQTPQTEAALAQIEATILAKYRYLGVTPTAKVALKTAIHNALLRWIQANTTTAGTTGAHNGTGGFSW